MNKLHVWIPLFFMVCLIGSISSEPVTTSLATDEYTSSFQINEHSQQQRAASTESVSTQTLVFKDEAPEEPLSERESTQRQHLMNNWSIVINELSKKKTKIAYDEL
ncbi:hypothetical protein ACI2JA_16345 [Alkalihalobacillus sp. NPDC078783]